MSLYRVPDRVVVEEKIRNKMKKTFTEAICEASGQEFTPHKFALLIFNAVVAAQAVSGVNRGVDAAKAVVILCGEDKNFTDQTLGWYIKLCEENQDNGFYKAIQ